MRRPASDSALRCAAVLCLVLVAPGMAQEPPSENAASGTAGEEPSASAPGSDEVETEALEAPEEEDEKAEHDDEDSEPETLATLILAADAPCTVTVDGKSRGELKPGDFLEVEVESLGFEVTASALDAPTARWSDEFELEEDEVREVSIPVLKAIEALRRLERRDGIFRDLELGLMWARKDNARDVTWAAAGDYCEELQLGGFDDWRLGTIDELESLETMWSQRALKLTDRILLSACCPWSSTRGGKDTIWNMDFRFRRRFESNPSLSFGLRALCTRDMLPDELVEAVLAADPKERKRRLEERRKRKEERESRRKAKQDNDNSTSVEDPP